MYRTRLQRTFNPWEEIFDDFFGQLPQTAPRAHAGPAVNTWKDDDKAVVEVELPGVEPGDVDISIEGVTLTIAGERKTGELAEEERYQYRERWHGKFSRSFELPYDVDSEKVEAAYKDGVLTVTLPRAEADKPRKIEITLN